MRIIGLILPGLVSATLITLLPIVHWGSANGLWRPAIAHAQEDWKKEFEEVCSKTQDAMLLGTDELKNLVERCDKLRPRVETLEEPARKVYLKRLQLCRDLFSFVLESKQKK